MNSKDILLREIAALGDDEPALLVPAKSPLAIPLAEYYVKLLDDLDADAGQIARRLLEQMRHWQESHISKRKSH